MVPHKLNNDTIYLHVLAGFGNRLRALVSGICLAEDLKKKLVILWKPNSTCKISFPECFDVKSLPYSYNQTMQTENFANIKTYDIENYKENTTITIESYYPFYKAYTSRWYEHLRSIRFNKSFNDDPLKENVIGIHIRRTDHLDSIKHYPNQYFIEKIKSELEKDSTVQFYLATDCEETKEIILKNFKDRIITNKFLLNRNSKNGMIHALTDFLKLSQCSKVIGSTYSSYSTMAAAYGNKPFITE
jgi:hypothetical protein